jgi:hypothetical protein
MARQNKRVVKQVVPVHKQIKSQPVNQQDIKIINQSVDYQARDFKKNPAWRFNKTDKEGPFAWPEACGKTALEIFVFLHSLDSMSWNEILGGKNNHSIDFEKMSKPAQVRFIERGFGDHTDSLISLRATGETRIFCYISDGHVANLCWYDPHHQVCISKKKHT